MSLDYKKIISKGRNAFVIQGASLVAILIQNWYLATIMGKTNYGIVTYAFSWIFLLGSLSLFGLNLVLIRETARYEKDSQHSKIIGLVKFSCLTNVAITVLIATTAFLSVNYIIPIENKTLKDAVLLSTVALPFFGQLLILQSACVGLKKMERALYPERVVRPLLFVIFIFTIFKYNDGSITIAEVILFNILAFAIAAAISFVFLTFSLPKQNIKPTYDNKKWLALGCSFFFLSATVAINSRADIIMLGIFGYTEDVGVYFVSGRFAQFVGLPLLLTNSITAPYISEFFNSNLEDISSIIKKTTRIVFIVGSLVLLILIFLGSFILSLHGEGFKEGYYCLIILAAGQFISICFGPVGNILTMSDCEALALKGMIGSTVINIVLNALLIPIYNINGAAIATTTSLIFWNILLFILVKKRLGINPSII